MVRLLTPGTLTEDSLLDAKARNYLTAIFDGPSSAADQSQQSAQQSAQQSTQQSTQQSAPQLAPQLALASLDISTGEFEVGEVLASDLPGEIVRLAPSEVIAADRLLANAGFRRWIAVAGATRLVRFRGASLLQSARSSSTLSSHKSARHPASDRRVAPRLPTVSSSTRRAVLASSCCAPSRASEKDACFTPLTAR